MRIPQKALFCCAIIVAFLIASDIICGAQNHANNIDVTHYALTLEPDIANKSVKGTVLIRFLIKSNNLTHAEFDCGDLTIDSVRLRGTTLQFAVKDRRLKVTLPAGLKKETCKR